jgi:hypothetical protein
LLDAGIGRAGTVRGMTLPRRTGVLLTAFALSAAGLSIGLGAPSAAAPAFCSAAGQQYPTGDRITWTGGGDHKSWNDAANWDVNEVPDANQIKTIYQSEYVCIGGGADVTIPKGKAYHVEGVDVGQNATLTIAVGSRLFLGSTDPDRPASYVEKGSTLTLDAAVLGGNAEVKVAGRLAWNGQRVGTHKEVATQTSSECVFDPSISACPGDTAPGGGLTTVTPSGKLLIAGKGFGGVVLGDQREIDNFGTIKIAAAGYVLMNHRTTLFNESGSTLLLHGPGGIYDGAAEGYAEPAAIHQSVNSAISKDAPGSSVVAVATKFSAPAIHEITVSDGTLGINARNVRKARVSRGSEFGIGSCEPGKNRLCRAVQATAARPQKVLVAASTAGPKVSKFAIKFGSATTIHGRKVIGKPAVVTAPTKRTTHSTRLTFSFDATIKGVSPKTAPAVYRNKHKITLCKVHGLTAKNTSCVISEGPAKGSKDANGDLEVVVISIQPNATWTVAK